MTYSTKTCNKCKQSKSKKDFFKDRTKRDGLSYSCKSCKANYNKEYQRQNKEQIQKQRKYFREKNKELVLIQKKEYYQANKEKILERQKEYEKNRRKSDPLYRCIINTRALIGRAFANQNLSKKSKTFKILGCSPEWFYNEWLEKKYNPPHSHLDHIIPISLAQNEKEVVLLNHYSNFQVLSSKQNISKGNRYIFLQGLNKVLENHPNFKDVKSIINREGIEVR